jgi:hypothetical protein
MDDQGSIRERCGEGIIFVHHSVQAGSGAHPASHPMCTEVKRPGHEANHSPPPNAEVKNAWNYTSTPPCLHGVLLSSPRGQLYQDDYEGK